MRCSPEAARRALHHRAADRVLYFPTRVVSIITIYGIQDFLGLINSTSGLILPYITLNLAVSVLIMRSVFQLVPHELMDAAHIDGAGVWRSSGWSACRWSGTAWSW